MPSDKHALLVRLYNEAAISDEQVETIEIEADFVSLVNGGTYGPPPLVAPSQEGGQPRARPGDVVLFINTSSDGVAAFEIERVEESDS